MIPSVLRRLPVAAMAVVGAVVGPLVRVDAQAPSAAPAAGGGQARLAQVATFDHQVTGVSVAADGRIFVNFPRWTEDVPISVAEVMKDGSIRPFPNAEWNGWRNATKNRVTPDDHWVCVQSVVVDGRGNLWVLDAAAPANGALVPNGPKLVRIELTSNRVAQTIAFDTTVAPNGSYLNDVRFSPDGAYAYITDSGGQGALVVVDLGAGTARRLLAAHPSVQPEKSVVVHADGREVRRPDGRGVEFAADGIALSADGANLYWQALTGRTLYRIATSALRDAALSTTALAARVERVGTTHVADGLWMTSQNVLFLTAPEDDAIRRRGADGAMTTVIRDPRLRWPDTFSQGADGALYVTASRIQDMSWYKPQNPIRLRTSLYRITGAGVVP